MSENIKRKVALLKTCY